MKPTPRQLRSLYRQCHWLTNMAFQPIHIVRLDERTGNLFILARRNRRITTSQIDYASMTLDEVKQYFLEHRDDQEAFYAYMDKLHASGRAIVIDPGDPNSEAKAIDQIKERMGQET